jgi:hypothetical protein
MDYICKKAYGKMWKPRRMKALDTKPLFIQRVAVYINLSEFVTRLHSSYNMALVILDIAPFFIRREQNSNTKRCNNSPLNCITRILNEAKIKSKQISVQAYKPCYY